MRDPSLVRRITLQVVRLAFCITAIGALSPVRGQTSASSGNPPLPSKTTEVLLEVVNRHFTIGKKIPSVYLRLFSDGTAECHTMNSGEKDAVKIKHLQPKEFAEVQTVLNQPGLRDVKGRYELPRMVFDSWMEWDLRIGDSAPLQNVTVSFAGSAGQRGYPDALRRLGCLIVKLRNEVYGDNTDYYQPACTGNSSNLLTP